MDTLFKIASSIVLIGWIALLAAYWIPVWAQRIAALAIPLMLSVVYAGLMLTNWSDHEGGFDTLDNVMQLFTQRELVLAGWIHYLAFDLLVGAWEVRTATREGISHWFLAPCLLLTFIFGPVGFLLFSALRLIRHHRSSV